MRTLRWLPMSLLALSALSACGEHAPWEAPSGDGAQTHSDPVSTAATLRAAAVEEAAHLPIGVPLAAYTSRLQLALQAPDQRTSPYTTEFIPSAGVQTRIPIKVIWLENGSNDIVFVKLDIGYAFDGVLFQLEDAISLATGVDVHGSVLFSTSHSHSSYGCFSHDPALYLGSDQFNTEIFQRLTDQITEVASRAHAQLEPAAIGVGFDPNFDPITENRIFRDRRSENNELVGVDGEILGPHKDPRLTLIRIDASKGTSSTSDDTPIALVHSYGIHGTIMGADNPLTSTEGSGHIDVKVQEQFNAPVVVMHLQGAAGDQSPAGIQNDFARMESLGEIAAPKIMATWQLTRTRSGDVPVEMITRSIHQDRDRMRITRRGTADYYYSPYTPRYQGDDVVYGADGKVLSPIDEFNTIGGAALCTDDQSMIWVGLLFGWGSKVPPYYTCGNVEDIVKLMDIPLFDFDLGWVESPLLTARSTVVSVIKLPSVPITTTDGTSTTDHVVFGVFPGEPVSLYSDTFRKLLQDTYGYKWGVTIGYSQDHEGYLLTLEDWLAGGYEPEINQWGPIQGEYILEQTVALAGQLGINNPSLPESSVPNPEYDYFPLEPALPDITATAGTVPSRVPSYLYTFDGEMPRLVQPEARLERLTDLATFLWIGGDSAIDLPTVVLEKETSPNSNLFVEMRHKSGRPWSESGPEILLTYTPDPLKDNGPQTHYWLATFQPVLNEPSLEHSAGLSTGRYRFRVEGQAAFSDPGSFPWTTTPYVLYSQPFEVGVNTQLVVTPQLSGSTLSLAVAYPGPERGYRLVSMNAQDSRSPSPLNRGTNADVRASVAIYDATDTLIWQTSSVLFTTGSGVSNGSVTPTGLKTGTYRVVVTDVFGNFGSGSFTVS